MDSAEHGSTIRKPFIDHVHELQVRLTWIVVAVVVASVAGYLMNEKLLALIQKPLGETLYYTSPTGGFSFVFKMSVVFGIVASLPVITLHLLGFTKPLIKRGHRWIIVKFITCSMILAACGVLFAYLVSLPAALNFLTNFGGQQIESLITADEYFNFALAYIGGFAVLFQLPLLMLLMNRIKPMKPSQMMKGQRYVIIGSFVVAAILTPTPDPVNQAIMAIPVIVLYQLSILLVMWANWRHKAPSTKQQWETVVVTPKVIRSPKKVAKPILSMVEIVPVEEPPRLVKPAPRLIDMVVT